VQAGPEAPPKPAQAAPKAKATRGRPARPERPAGPVAVFGVGAKVRVTGANQHAGQEAVVMSIMKEGYGIKLEDGAEDVALNGELEPLVP
jgi:sRNA-binding protein